MAKEEEENQNSIGTVIQMQEESIAKETPHKEENHQKKTKFTKKLIIHNVLKTASYWMLFILLGIVLASPGPVLVYISENTKENIASMGWVFTCRGFGYILGSSFGGRLLDILSNATKSNWKLYSSHTGPHFLYFVALALMSVSMLVVPIFQNFYLVLASYIFNGIGCGFLDTSANVLVVMLWREKVNPFMQALHAFFGIGAFFSPICIGYAIEVFEYTFFQVNFAISVLHLFVFVVLFLLQILYYFVYPLHEEDDPSNSVFEIPLQSSTIPLDNNIVEKFKSFLHNLFSTEMIVTYFMAGALFCIVGLEISYSGLLTTYITVTELAPKLEADKINSAFWLAFTLGRLAAILFSIFLKPFYLLVIDIVGVIIAALLLLFFGNVVTVLWIGSILMGLAMASQFPSAINYPVSEQHLQIKELSGTCTGIMVVGSAIGEMFVPLLITIFTETVGPNALFYGILLLCGAAVFMYTTVFVYSIWKRIQYNKLKQVNKILVVQEEEEEEVELEK